MLFYCWEDYFDRMHAVGYFLGGPVDFESPQSTLLLSELGQFSVVPKSVSFVHGGLKIWCFGLVVCLLVGLLEVLGYPY